MKKRTTAILSMILCTSAYSITLEDLNPMNYDWSKLNPMNYDWSWLNPANSEIGEKISDSISENIDVEALKEDIKNMPTHGETRVGTSLSGSNAFGLEVGTSMWGTYVGLGGQYDKRNTGFGASHIPLYTYAKKAYIPSDISWLDYRAVDFLSEYKMVPYLTGRLGKNIYAEKGESGGAHYGLGVGMLLPTMSVELLWTGTNLKAEYKNTNNFSIALGYRF